MIEWIFILVLTMKTTVSPINVYQCDTYDRFRYPITYITLKQDVPKNVDFSFIESDTVNAVTVRSKLTYNLCILLTSGLLDVLKFDRDFLLFIIYHEIAHSIIGKINLEYPIHKNVFDHCLEIICDLLAVKLLMDNKVIVNFKKLPMLFDIIDSPTSETHPSSKHRKLILESFIAYVTKRNTK